MSRDLGWRDMTATWATVDLGRRLRLDIIHGHGAKGGAYARLAAGRLKSAGQALHSFYTPHGGSLHYAPSSLKGRIFMALERRLAKVTDGIIFESAYSAQVYARNVTPVSGSERIIPNGLLPREFGEHRPASDATDVIFVGELRYLKGVDVMLRALAQAPGTTATIVGDGPDRAAFVALAGDLGIGSRVSFPGAMPALQAFTLGRVLVMPSRAESFPYIVLEAAAAGIPIIATAVGGIPEITGGTDTALIPADDAVALAQAIAAALANPVAAKARSARLRSAVAARFTVERMAGDILNFYRAVAGRSAAPELEGGSITRQRRLA